MKRILTGIIVIAAVASSANPAEEPARHPMVDAGRCEVCHVRLDSGGTTAELISPVCDTCSTCHQPKVTDHPVAVKPVFNTDPGLPLDTEGMMTCVTCHNPHLPRFDTRPWQSVSLAGRILNIFQRPSSYDTYLLRRRNLHGELCLSCHREL